VLLQNLAGPYQRRYMTRGPTVERNLSAFQALIAPLIFTVYMAVFATLFMMSFAGHWPFPNLFPDTLHFSAWARLLSNSGPVLTSLWLAISTSAAALIAVVLWFECQPEKHDKLVYAACALALCMPSLVIALGQYRLFLRFDLTGTATAMFLAHVLPVTAYTFIMLSGPYRAFDQRWSSVASGLLASRVRFLFAVKWPMLKASLLSTIAVGFAVSVAQYVPAQLAASGRYSTLPMEAVTLSSGGNRQLLAAYALALTVLPLIAFAAAGWFGRARWEPSRA
jgi:putative thiamine transport system permease protein